ncbi:MAG: BatD family protein, partial [Bacteroidota bacterium]
SAQVAVSGYADKTVLSEGDVLTFTIEITGTDDVDALTPPRPSRHLELLSRAPSIRQRTTYGAQTRLRLGWRYRAVAEGSGELGTMRGRAGSQTFSTDPIPIRVTARSRQRPPSAPTPDPRASGSGASGGLFVRAVPKSREVVVGEQVLVDYVLYFDATRFSPRQAIATGTWDAPGFWREELDVPTSETYPRPATLGGRSLQAVTIRRLALFPARSGTLELAPMDFQIEMREAAQLDPFSPFFSPFRSRRIDRTVTAPETTVGVSPLPPGAPATFGGAVGTFEMDAQLSSPEAQTAEPVELIVTIRGTGNVATMAAPEIEAPPGVDAYAPDSERSSATSQSPLVSTRRFTYTYVPQGGSFEIPEVAWTYFDPEEGQYRTLRSGPFPVATAGAALASGETPSTAGSWQRSDSLGVAPLWGVLGVGLGLPAVAALGLVASRRRRQRPLVEETTDPDARLAAASNRPAREQAAETVRVVREALASRLGPDARRLSRREIVDRLTETVSRDRAAAIGAVLARCEAVRYAGATGDADLAADARRALDALDA